ncbi:3'-5' exonuclease [Marinoscillum pacificum]|uniref:3'-5' exonuclease n=1 Tax=Marinoscillum pacificum TaxID=392723 RepID=UPI002157B14D|nr:3'-5' exonuclease [Marinoscillum pacificum]
MHDYLLFLDTETSGIPTSLHAPITDLDNWPFVLQIAWLIYTPGGKLVKKENLFIYEEDIYIKQSSERIHGITREELKAKGLDRKSVMKAFASDLRQYKPMIIGHFVEFDSKMVQVAFFRSGLKNIISPLKHFCTMLPTKAYARLPHNTYPKLEDLYFGLFKEKLEDTHNALNDAEATAKCFFSLKDKGEINEQVIASQRLFINIKDKKSSKAGCGLPILVFILIGLLSIWL